jgi:hypothetical protein
LAPYENFFHLLLDYVKIMLPRAVMVKHKEVTITSLKGEFLTRGGLGESDQRSSQVDFWQ